MSSSAPEKSSVPVTGIEGAAVKFLGMAVNPDGKPLNAGESELFLSSFCGIVSGRAGQIQGTTVAKLCMLSVTSVEIGCLAVLF